MTDPSFRWLDMTALAAVLLLAALLLFVDLGHSPPGVQLDAAANAWNAHCLLEEGKDAAGESWPVFQYRAYGESRSTLALYALLPFQATLGMSLVSTALPTAAGGLLSVFCLWFVGKRLFSPTVGLVAAAMLAVAPWHLFLGRYGQEAGLVPLLVVGPMAALLWAGLPLADHVEPRSALRAAVAGAAVGIACYGYLAVRIALPALVIIAVLGCWRGWLDRLATPVGRKTVLAVAMGAFVTLGPLVVKHLTDPMMAERANAVRLWSDADTPAARAGKVATRYLEHFGPDFLFVRGDTYFWNSVPGTAPLSWYMAPLLVAGVIAAAAKARSSPSARVALAWLVAYPVADSVAFHPSLHSLRSAPGLCGLVLLAALGACGIGAWLRARSRKAAMAFVVAGCLVGGTATVRFLGVYFGSYSRGAETYVNFSQDLLDACAWLRPRMGSLDGVFISRQRADGVHAYAVVAFGLNYVPRRWFAEERRTVAVEGRQYCVGFGKIHLMMKSPADRVLARLRADGRLHHVAFVLRPGETIGFQPSFVVRLPDGRPSFYVYELNL